ncbi:MAG TPA: hypothetical protein VKA50_04000 [Gammaproteobacteria bacterium]|nr:hypothetical protein [Gammaproteobacteria bacterium]
MAKPLGRGGIMGRLSNWGEALSDWFGHLADQVAGYLPNLLGAIAILLGGWILAKLLRGLTLRLAGSLDRLFERMGRVRGVHRVAFTRVSAGMLGGVVFWLTILIFLTAATQVLGLAAFTDGLQRVLAYLPTLLAGGLIILAGFLLSALARDLLVSATPTRFQERALLGRIVQITVIVTAVVIGADQAGIDVTFVVVLAAILVATVAGALAVAVSLGARSYVANLIGSHYLRRTYRPGQRLSVAGFEGRLLELSATSLVLETRDGRVAIPSKVFNDEAIVLRIGDDPEDTDGESDE